MPESAGPVPHAPKPSRRRRWWIVAGGVALAVGAIVTWALWPSGPYAVPGTVQASVVSADDASKALGQTLKSRHGASQPAAALLSDPVHCAVAVGPATRAVYADGWTTFGSVTYQVSEEEASHTVTQVVGMYPTGEQARQVFGTLSAGMDNCESAVRDGGASGRASAWSYTVEQNTADTVIWTATQDAGDGWACYRQARLKGRALLQVAVCQAGDGRQAAAAIADQFTSRVGG